MDATTCTLTRGPICCMLAWAAHGHHRLSVVEAGRFVTNVLQLRWQRHATHCPEEAEHITTQRCSAASCSRAATRHGQEAMRQLGSSCRWCPAGA